MPNSSQPDAQTATWLRLMEEYQPALRRLANSYVADAGAREDLFQEIGLGIWRAVPRFRGESSERTWIYRIAHNIALSTIASRRRHQDREIELDDSAIRKPAFEDPDRGLLVKEQQERLMAAIRGLPAIDRQLVVLHIEGLSHTEIEQVAGLSQNAIATRLSRIRDRLAATLRKEEERK